MFKKYFFVISLILFLGISGHSASAAIMYISPENVGFNRGVEFSVDVKIDSEEEAINAAQATINWPANILEFVGADKASSVFNFWVEEPTLSGSSSSLSFVAGTAKGISGGTLQVFKIKFKALGTGAGEISISDAGVTASDGKGTNILSASKSSNFGAGKAPAVSQPQESAPEPVAVVRSAVLGQKLPAAPVVKVSLYPDPAIWHNSLGELVALWDVSPDISEMSVSLDHNSNGVPSAVEKELATGKKFGVLEEGIWYLHVRFRNNIGWSPVTHYRIAIDTQPPLPFEITLPEGSITDNPTPIFQFKTSDALSGLKEYQVRINGNEAVKIPVAEFKGDFALPLQAPGQHRVVVRAIDEAGNSIEDDESIEILPIPSPTFSFVTKELFSEENRGLSVKGSSLPNADALLELRRISELGTNDVVTKKIARANNQGNWEATFEESLRNGEYYVIAQSRDSRGALSLTVESERIQVKSKPIISIGLFHLGKGAAALSLLLILIASFFGGVWFYKKRQEKISNRIIFTESEVSKIFKLITQDVENLSKSMETPTPSDDEYAFKRLKDNLKKMESYIQKGLEKIKK